MIKRLTLKNFKNVTEQTYEFSDFDLLVGRNNSGKSTVLQALAIWQFCVDEFHRSKRGGSKGIQVVLPNFTALPVPEFNLLWKDKTERRWPEINGRKKQEFILVEIQVEWLRENGERDEFGVQLRYHSPQTIYAIPSGGWAKFRACEQQGDLPIIAYVPPFSGLEPTEKRLDDAPVRQQVGKGQPGSVLRNLLLRVYPSASSLEKGDHPKKSPGPPDWQALVSVVERWFSVKISRPQYEPGKDVFITVEYRHNDKNKNSKNFDIIAGGSGFHQTLTLLAFLYGYRPTTILLDEPDAHLHVNLQREILDYFKQKSAERNIQFLIATHAEEFVRGVDASQIISLLQQTPNRIESTPEVLRAMADVSNEEITRLLASPYLLYVEGESDERLLRAFAQACDAQGVIEKLHFKTMGGGGKENMRKRAEDHFNALKQIVPKAKRMMLFDLDDGAEAFHPKDDNPALMEWRRKNIENYLLVPEAWQRAVLRASACQENDLFTAPAQNIVRDFFINQNLTLPPNKTWRMVEANIFELVDGKRILFENDDSLFQQLRAHDPLLLLLREKVAAEMKPDDIHEDIHRLFSKLTQMF